MGRENNPNFTKFHFDGETAERLEKIKERFEFLRPLLEELLDFIPDGERGLKGRLDTQIGVLDICLKRLGRPEAKNQIRMLGSTYWDVIRVIKTIPPEFSRRVAGLPKLLREKNPGMTGRVSKNPEDIEPLLPAAVNEDFAVSDSFITETASARDVRDRTPLLEKKFENRDVVKQDFVRSMEELKAELVALLKRAHEQKASGGLISQIEEKQRNLQMFLKELEGLEPEDTVKLRLASLLKGFLTNSKFFIEQHKE